MSSMPEPFTTLPVPKNPILRDLYESQRSTLLTSGMTGSLTIFNDYKLPDGKRCTDRTPGEGRRILKIRRVPMMTTYVVSELMKKLNDNATSDHNIAQDFDHFCEINDVDHVFDRDFLLLIFAVDMTLQGLKPSSALTYVNAILRMNRRQGNPVTGCHVGDAIKILSFLDSEEEAKHAVDVTLEQALRIMLKMSGIAQATIWFMITCGARVKDLTRLKRSQIEWRVDSIAINFKFTKNHRANLDQYTVIVPVVLPVVDSVVQILHCKSDACPFTLDVDAINDALHKTQEPMYPWLPTLDEPEEPLRVTSYSFRRRFVQETIAMHTNEQGFTNWLDCAKLTAHYEIKVLRNRYTGAFQNTL